jgi:hypothetical protein
VNRRREWYLGPVLNVRSLTAATLAGVLGAAAIAGCTGQPLPHERRRIQQAQQAKPVEAAELIRLFDLAEVRLGNDPQTALRIARECIERASVAEDQAPGRVYPVYFRALCKTVHLRTKFWGSRTAAKEMEKDAKEAVRRDEGYESGGPLRLLGMFYLRAPRWPSGPGDVEKGTELLRRAREKYPQQALNRLFYAEALVASGEGPLARAELQGLDDNKLDAKWRSHAQRLRTEAANK